MTVKINKIEVSIIAVVVLVGLFLIFKENELQNTEAYKISQSCKVEKRMGCITSKVLAVVDKNPEIARIIFNDFANLLKNKIITDDPRLFSPLIHYVGMELADLKVEPKQAFEDCGYNFKQGCLHGYIMERLENIYGNQPFDDGAQKMVKDFFLACDFAKKIPFEYNNCIHAVGHEIAAKQKGTINDVLEWCKEAPMNTTNHCVSGALMEFSTGRHGNGKHTHDPLSGAAMLPCEEAKEEFESTCYAAQAAYVQYVPGRESFLQTANYCSSVPEKYRDSCILGLAEKIFTVNVENPEEAKKNCESFLDKNSIDECKVAVEEIESLESVL